MTKNIILVQRIDMENSDLSISSAMDKKMREILPKNIKSIMIPHTWDFKQVDEKVVYIGFDKTIDVETTIEIINNASENLGEEYVIVSNICKADVISEK